MRSHSAVTWLLIVLSFLAETGTETRASTGRDVSEHLWPVASFLLSTNFGGRVQRQAIEQSALASRLCPNTKNKPLSLEVRRIAC